MWGGFALFWEATVLTSDDPGFFVLWGIPFVGFGLYFVFGRFLFKRRKKRRTAYGITPERVMVAVGTSGCRTCPCGTSPCLSGVVVTVDTCPSPSEPEAAGIEAGCMRTPAWTSGTSTRVR